MRLECRLLLLLGRTPELASRSLVMLDCMWGVDVVERDPNVAAKDMAVERSRAGLPEGVADVCLKLAA